MQLYYYNGQATNYQIDETGKLYNLKTKKFLKGSINKLGYLVYRVSLGGFSKDLYAHRMVAETFIQKPFGKDCVNHKDGNKLNNSILNLEWVTKKENNIHAIENNLNILNKKVFCFDKKKTLICVYESLESAHFLTGIAINSIADNASAISKPLCKGFYFNYSEDSSFQTYETKGGGRKPIGKYSLDNILIDTYETITEAATVNHFPRARLSDCAHGKIKTYGGYIWKFIL